jgi:hypothetical protein
MTLHLFDAVLQKHWFPTLPQSVKEGLKTGPSTNRMYIAFVSSNLLIFHSTVPRALTSWWILWNHTNPTAYPLPQGLLLNEPLSVSDDPDWSDQLITTHGSETRLGVAVRQAWEHIEPVDRELMLFCWAARQNHREDRLCLAHPKPTLTNALDILDYDLVGDLVLRVRAAALISTSPYYFTDI